MSRITFPRLLSAVAATVLLVAPLAACSAGSLPTSTAMLSDVDGSADGSAPSDAAEATAGSASAAEAPRAEKSIVRTGDLSLAVDSPKAASEQVERVAEQLGGSVESLSLWGSGEGSSASLVVRVSADRLDEAFASLREIGAVESENRSAVDVTTEHVDLKARVAALETSIERLQGFIADSGSMSELLEAEGMLSARQQELDGLRAQLKALEGQVAESTISVSLTGPSALPGGGPNTFWEGLLAGFASLGSVGAGALVVLGVLLPWLAIAGIIALVVVLMVRRARARRRRATAATATRAATSTTNTDPAQMTPVASPEQLVADQRDTAPRSEA